MSMFRYLRVAEAAYLAALSGMDRLPGLTRAGSFEITEQEIYYARFDLERRGVMRPAEEKTDEAADTMSKTADIWQRVDPQYRAIFETMAQAETILLVKSFDPEMEDVLIFCGACLLEERLSLTQNKTAGFCLHEAQEQTAISLLRQNGYLPEIVSSKDSVDPAAGLPGGRNPTGPAGGPVTEKIRKQLQAGLTWQPLSQNFPIRIPFEFFPYMRTQIVVYSIKEEKNTAACVWVNVNGEDFYYGYGHYGHGEAVSDGGGNKERSDAGVDHTESERGRKTEANAEGFRPIRPEELERSAAAWSLYSERTGPSE